MQPCEKSRVKNVRNCQASRSLTNNETRRYERTSSEQGDKYDRGSMLSRSPPFKACEWLGCSEHPADKKMAQVCDKTRRIGRATLKHRRWKRGARHVHRRFVSIFVVLTQISAKPTSNDHTVRLFLPEVVCEGSRCDVASRRVSLRTVRRRRCRTARWCDRIHSCISRTQVQDAPQLLP